MKDKWINQHSIKTYVHHILFNLLSRRYILYAGVRFISSVIISHCIKKLQIANNVNVSCYVHETNILRKEM